MINATSPSSGAVLQNGAAKGSFQEREMGEIKETGVKRPGT